MNILENIEKTIKNMKQFNPSWRGKYQAARDVTHIELERFVKNKKKIHWQVKHGYGKLSKCTQCKGWMRSDIAKIQIENKRENAPICFKCLLN